MNVLIACEFSGQVRDAFRARGHNAWSCDLEGIKSEGYYSNYHWYGDCRELIRQSPYGKFDLMIAHPPCTYLCNSGVRWLKGNDQRWEAMKRACEFFKDLLYAPVDKIAIENPIMHAHAKLQIGVNYQQKIQPWMFGHGEVKATCFWLKNLQPLKPTNIVNGREARVHRMAPNKDRGKERSRTLFWVAQAMADQWGK